MANEEVLPRSSAIPDLLVHVFDALSGKPIQGARMKVDLLDDALEFRSDSRGEIAVPCMHRAPNEMLDMGARAGLAQLDEECDALVGVAIQVSAEGYTLETRVVSDWLLHGNGRPIIVSLGQTGRIHIEVLDEHSVPIHSAFVRASWSGTDLLREEEPRLGRVPLGRKSRLRRDALTGRVRREGFLGSHRLEGRTDLLGRLDLEVPATVQVDVLVVVDGIIYPAGSHALNFGELRSIAWKRPQGFAVTGLLRDPRGHPFGNVEMCIARHPDPSDLRSRLVRGDEVLLARVRTNSAGAFTFENVPEGAWIVVPQSLLNWPPSAGGLDSLGCVGASVRVPDDCGQPLELDMLEPLYIVGRIYGVGHGEEGPGITYVFAESASIAGRCETQSTQDGRYWLGPLAEGVYTVSGQSNFGEVEPRTVEVSYPSPVSLDLRIW